MKIAVSNIGLPEFDHLDLLPRLAEIGVAGVEIAPSRVWHDTWTGLTASAVAGYGAAMAAAGLKIVGLHSLFFDHPELGMFKGVDTLERTVDFTAHLSAVCRDLGGRTLIYGGGRKREGMAMSDAKNACDSFLNAVLPRLESHGTKLCFEPLGPNDADFLNTAAECTSLADRFDHPALGRQLDAKALVDNNEVSQSPFVAVAGRLDHFHANDPGLVVVGSTGIVDHAKLGRHLASISYDGWISSEQRMLNAIDPLADIALSVQTISTCYREAS